MISALVTLTDWTPNPTLTQNFQHLNSPTGHPGIAFTEPYIIATILQSEPLSPQINVLSGVDVNQVNVYQTSLGYKIVPLFPEYDQGISTYDLRIIVTL